MRPFPQPTLLERRYLWPHLDGRGNYATNLGQRSRPHVRERAFFCSFYRVWVLFGLFVADSEGLKNPLRLFVAPFHENAGYERWNSAAHTRHITVSVPQTSHLEETGNRIGSR